MPLYGTKSRQSEPNYILPCAGWSMDQSGPVALLIEPKFAYCYGVDGSSANGMKRFRGFRRLDYDIREYSDASFVSVPVNSRWNVGYTSRGAFSDRTAPHDWNGYPAIGEGFSIRGGGVLPVGTTDVAGANGKINAFRYSLIDFMGVTIDRMRGRKPIVGFVVQFLDDEGHPVVKLMGRGLGDSSRSALFQTLLYHPAYSRTITARAIPEHRYVPDGRSFAAPLFMSMPSVNDELTRIDTEENRIGVAGLGRLLFTTHALGNQSEATNVVGPGFSGGFDTGFAVLTRALDGAYSKAYAIDFDVSGTVGTELDGNTHIFISPDTVTHPVPNNAMSESFKGDKFLVSKLAGAKNFDWFDPEGPSDARPYFSILSGDGGAAAAGFTAGDSFKVRIRFINRTTGFVGPMSPFFKTTIGVGVKRKRIAWANPGVFGNAGDAKGFRGEWALRSLVGGEPGTKMEDDNYDIFMQIFRTTTGTGSTGGVYYLDEEVPISISSGTGSGYQIYPSEHTTTQGTPSLADEGLVFQELYDPEFDQPGELSASRALGEVDGELLSLQAAGSSVKGQADISRDDIRVSPPWKFFPSGWLEAVAFRLFHKIRPKSIKAPGFVSAGNFAFFVNQNRLVRCERQGTRVNFVDVGDGLGAVNREAATSAVSSLFLVTDSDLIQLNVNSTAWQSVNVVKKIIQEKWRDKVRDGQMLCGFDPQTLAVYIAPKRASGSTEWLRSEAIVLWLSTNRVTMLSDVYWVGMSRAMHPITGKEHLFMVDPAGNITYPDESVADDSDQVATMTGINAFKHPDLDKVQATATINITDYSAIPSGMEIIIDGISFVEGTDWTAATSDTATALELKNAMDLRFVGGQGLDYPSVGTVTQINGILTLTAARWGVAGNNIPVVITPDTTPGISVTTFTGGDATKDRSGETYGGVVRGAITDTPVVLGAFSDDEFGLSYSQPSIGLQLFIRDANAGVENKGAFDRYSWDNWARTSSVINGGFSDGFSTGFAMETDTGGFSAMGFSSGFSQVVGTAGGITFKGGLVGSQVYFFRKVLDSEGVLQTTLIGDALILDNNEDSFSLATSNFNMRVDSAGAAYSLSVGDQYSISPVVFQVIGPPLGIGSRYANMLQAVSVNNIGYSATRLQGFAAKGATQYPSDGMQNDMFLGVTDPTEVEDMTLGGVLTPGVERAVPLTAAVEDTFVNTPSLGVSRMPVVSNYGTDANFELKAIHLRANIEADVEPSSLE